MFDVPLNMIRAFAAVYDAGGIRPAARKLGVTHTSVLRFVRELEAFLNVDLTEKHKGTRGLMFTPAGETLGKAALSSLAALEVALMSIREAQHRKSVVIETTPSIASRWLLPRLAALEASLNGVEISLVVDQKLREPGETGADIAIRSGLGPWPNADCIPLMDDTLFPVMSPAYWRQVGEFTEPIGLKECRLLHDRDPSASWSAWKANFGPRDLDVRSGSRLSSADLVLGAAEQSLGVALARRSLAEESIKCGHLIAPLKNYLLELPQSVWVVLPNSQTRRKVVDAVIERLHREAAPQNA